MAHLSTMDATFLYNETPESPMHVAGLAIFKPKDGYDGNIFEDYQKFLSDRVHLISYLHRRLGTSSFAPFDPIWIEDYDLDWDYHLRHNALPKPGTQKQLNELVERLHAVPLDRNRPLWQFYVIEGLEDGGFALYTKTHHACLDGGAGIISMEVLYDKTPEITTVEPPKVSGQGRSAQPEWVQQLTESYAQLMRQQIELFETAPQFLKALERLGRKAIDDIVHPKQGTSLTPPRTSLNMSIGRGRSFATLSLPLAEVKELGKSVGAKINDVVMMLSGGALRRYLTQMNELPNDPLVAGVPISLRKPGDYAMNNQVIMMFGSLATNIADPLERLKAIHDSLADAKDRVDMVKDTIHLEYSIYGAPLFFKGLSRIMSETKAADRLPPTMNAVVSNVPGSRTPMYLLGHEMEAYFPVSIPQHGVGLNMTVQSYCERLDFGIVTAKTAVSDSTIITDMLLEEYEAFKEAVAKVTAATNAEAAPKAAAPKTAAPKTAAPKRTAAAAAKKAPARKASTKQTAAKTGTAKRAAPKKASTPKSPT